MREIKFRGKKVDSGDWVEGSYQADVMSLDKHTIIYSDSESYYCEDEVTPETVGQYTGLKDNNGVEIYEGDICEFKLFNSRRVGVVLFSEEKYRYELLQSGDIDWSLEIHEAFDLEVIGNIHDQEAHNENA